MEEATGRQLGGIWDDLKLAHKLKIVAIEKKLLSRSFTRYVKAKLPLCPYELYNKLLDVSDYLLPNNKELNRSTIWHWDIHAPNLFVEGNTVTGLIDWQDIWAGPLFPTSEISSLQWRNHAGIPQHYKDIDDKDERARIRAQVEKSIVLWAYASDTKRTNPVLHENIDLPHGRTRKDAVVFSTNTWDDDILPFRQFNVTNKYTNRSHWDEMNNEVACPIKFTDEELKTHYREGEGWNEQAEFWDALRGFLDRDGWTSNEDYERALETFAELREPGLIAGSNMR
ncbi:phosphotransferase enzyme [Aspergillus viridinutans]|uniref:Altered inheritance of mitochondria protein 9, mitochondrial n=1 Tax=Aspergillus viridinutans TaxID=75553 RepID=A0A9P3F3X5_ASPVI|nr:phosphotransferase enzyme [Aspergillus viridinutans]GIK00478.1 phosphotransferase enzyme [Aspergillus viridinutans]